jgi:hypothetical protein
VDQQTCAFTARLKQTNRIQGGTRKFRHASGTFAGGVRAWGVLVRNPDGSCNEQADPLLEADIIFARGTLVLSLTPYGRDAPPSQAGRPSSLHGAAADRGLSWNRTREVNWT